MARELPHIANLLPKFLQRLGFNQERQKLCQLWRQWSEIMGEEVAELAVPIGHKEQTLFLGVEDNMAMQELHFHTTFILGVANAFMETEFFTELKIILAHNQRALNEILPQEEVKPVDFSNCAILTGCYLAQMDPDSPVTKAYAQFYQARLKFAQKMSENKIANQNS